MRSPFLVSIASRAPPSTCNTRTCHGTPHQEAHNAHRRCGRGANRDRLPHAAAERVDAARQRLHCAGHSHRMISAVIGSSPSRSKRVCSYGDAELECTHWTTTVLRDIL